MPATVPPNARAGSAGPDDLDNLLDYDGAVQDFWKDLPDARDGNAQDAGNEALKDMDEEVRVTKKRKPNPKLDDARLLSDAGIPKLRRITKDRLKFKGKGHEFADVSRMLNFYQLWLDDLYSKAKFRDALTMVEKLGHSKRMQVSRRAWIDETKASQRRDDEEDDRQADVDDMDFRPQADVANKKQGQQETGDQVPDEDDLDALFTEEGSAVQAQPQATIPVRKGPFQDDEDDEPQEDELDALLTEDKPRPQQASVVAPTQKRPFQEDADSDQDDLDALLAEESQRQQAAPSSNVEKPKDQQATMVDDDFADEEEAMRDMDW